MNEDSPVGTLSNETIEEINEQTYGPLKVLCERAVQQALTDRALIIRPGLIVGPHDPTDRFTYWPHRIAHGGEVLAPGDPDQAVQFIDARDLAEWIVRTIEARRTGIFNADGPATLLTMRQLLEEYVSVCDAAAHLTWVDEKFLIGVGVKPWSEIPVWFPAAEASFNAVNCAKAIGAGLTFRPLAETIRDTLAWDQTRANVEWRAGISLEREQHLLRDWHAAHDRL